MKKNIFGNYLRNLREQHGLTQPALAEQLSISNAFLNYIELSKRMPSEDTLKKFSEFFKVELTHLKDLWEKQKLLNKETANVPESLELPESIQKLSTLLLKVDKPLLENLVSDFMEQINVHLVQMTENFTLTDIRDMYRKQLSFDNNIDEPIVIEGFLKLPEDRRLFFKFTRVDCALTLEVLQSDRSKNDLFEKWIGPHVFSNICETSVPQVLEKQKGVSFTWFSPIVTLKEQYTYLLEQKLNIDSVLMNSSQLAWYIQQTYDGIETEYDEE